MQERPHGRQNDHQHKARIVGQAELTRKGACGKSPAQHRENQERKKRRLRDALANVPQFIMPKLVSEDR